MKKLLLTFSILAFLLIPTDVTYAAIVHVSTTPYNGTATTHDITSVTVTGTDPVLIVKIAYRDSGGGEVTAVVWDWDGVAEALTQLGSESKNGEANAQMWYLAAPTAKTATLRISTTNSVRIVAAASVYTGVDQTNPFRTAATASNNGTTASPTVTVIIRSGEGEMVVDSLAQVSAGPDTATGDHTERHNAAETGGGTDTRGASQEKLETVVLGVIMGWTMADGDNWAIIAAPLQEPQSEPSIPTLTLGTHRWFQNLDSLTPGRPASLNQAIVAPPQGTGFRLRFNLHVGVAEIAQSGTSTKLQFGVKNGAICDASGDETYSDVTTSSAISFYDNTGVADDGAITSYGFDPKHASSTTEVVNDVLNLQNYNDGTSNTTFINSQSAIPAGEDGLWDVSLQDSSAPPGTTYCFRIVQVGGGVLSSYGSSTLPEIRTQREVSVRLRGIVRLRTVRLN